MGLLVGAAKVRLGGEVELTVLGANGAPVAGAPPSNVWIVVPDAGALAILTPDGWRSAPQAQVTFAPTSPATSLTANLRPYRGRIVVLRDRTGLTVVNRVAMESYLAGVVSAEMGRREASEGEALAAQSVVSRTFALRNLGKRRSEGFDLYATVVDQVYGGIGSETALSWRAVRETSGRVLTYAGAPIDAFFFSTCGGRTADGNEVFANGGRPYLKSIWDTDRNGQAYCNLSPRFWWRQEWSGEELLATLQRTLPALTGVSAASVTQLRSVRVVGRTGSDRVARVSIDLGGHQVIVEGPAIRQALRPAADQLLRSNSFTLTETRTGDRLVRLVAEGMGAGHGVGFCQWGAVGRARAGQRYDEILTAYFKDVEIRRLY